MKFKYDYLANRLWKIKANDPRFSYEIPSKNQFAANFGGNGFSLENNAWIIFTVYERKIKVFAKFSQNEEIIYYRKEFPLIPLHQLPLAVPNFAREITFEFTEADRVIKNEGGGWVKKEPG